MANVAATPRTLTASASATASLRRQDAIALGLVTVGKQAPGRRVVAPLPGRAAERREFTLLVVFSILLHVAIAQRLAARPSTHEPAAVTPPKVPPMVELAFVTPPPPEPIVAPAPPPFAKLSGIAAKMLLELGRQYNGTNNGDLCATRKTLASRGWNSNDSMNRALRELEYYEFITKTRQGGKNLCSLYALGWRGIDECGGKLDLRPSPVPLSGWKIEKQQYQHQRIAA